MINFCRVAANAGVADKVASLFYDSNSNCCTIEVTDDVVPGDEIDSQLLAIGRKTLSQFEWHGSVEHGSSLLSD